MVKTITVKPTISKAAADRMTKAIVAAMADYRNRRENLARLIVEARDAEVWKAYKDTPTWADYTERFFGVSDRWARKLCERERDASQAEQSSAPAISETASDGRIDPTPAIPSLPQGVAVSEAVTPTREEDENEAADRALLAARILKDNGVRVPLDDVIAECGLDRAELERELDDEIAAGVHDTLSTSPADPSPAESATAHIDADGPSLAGASEGAPSDEHWAIAELRLMTAERDALVQAIWDGLVLIDAEIDERARPMFERMGCEGFVSLFIHECERAHHELDNLRADAVRRMLPARSIVEEEPERLEAAGDEIECLPETEPADDERRHAIRKVLAWLDALPPKERARFIRSHRIKDPSQWVNARTDAELTGLMAQSGATEEGA